MDLENNRKPRLGIVGGTFDPIHYGHLLAAELARTAFCLEKVLFIPAGNPPHKIGKLVSPSEWRYEMVRMAIEDNPYFESSPVEVQRDGFSYTFDTLSMLSQMYPEYELFFITGSDAFQEIFTWHRVAEALELARFVGVTRPGFDATGFLQQVEQNQPETKGKLSLLPVPASAISSTDIRTRVSLGQSIRYLVPEPVRLFIENKQLYI